MLRRVLPLLYGLSVSPLSRVGIFPLHLDPPTVQHRELFQLLVGDTENKQKSMEHNVDMWCFDSFRESLQNSELVPFDHLILVPNTRYPVALRLSTHLAALTVLAARGLSRVHVDFTALEHPDEDMPCIYELTQKYKNSTLVHWLHDAHEMQKWAHFNDVKLGVPMLLLQTISFPVEMIGKPRAVENDQPVSSVYNPNEQTMRPSKQHYSQLKQILCPEACKHASSPIEAEVEISRSYHCSSDVSWLATSPLEDAAAARGSNSEEPAEDIKITESDAKGSLLSTSRPLVFERTLSALQLRFPLRRKVRHLLEELFSVNHHQSIDANPEASASALSHLEVHPIRRCTGADVRQALWEREVDPSIILTDPVNRYIDSHGLYSDYRKGFLPKVVNFMNFTTKRTNSSKLKMSSTGFTASLSFSGLIPRLEIHYDKNNLLAREHYEKLRVYQVRDGEEPDLIVPIGGDGYMMHCIRNNWNRFIPFFGINAGHVGYLLNDPSVLEELFSAPLKLYTTNMLYCLAERETPSGEKVLLSELAFNDAWLERSSGQTAQIRILVNGEERIHLFRGDGVLVSTAAGSTAYCQALGASPVPVGAPLIQVVGSNVVSPAQWRPTHLNQEDQVELEVIDSLKRPCRCYVDSVDVGNVTRMLVRSSRAAGVAIAFACSSDLQQKLYQMQFPTTT